MLGGGWQAHRTHSMYVPEVWNYGYMYLKYYLPTYPTTTTTSKKKGRGRIMQYSISIRYKYSRTRRRNIIISSAPTSSFIIQNKIHHRSSPNNIFFRSSSSFYFIITSSIITYFTQPHTLMRLVRRRVVLFQCHIANAIVSKSDSKLQYVFKPHRKIYETIEANGKASEKHLPSPN